MSKHKPALLVRKCQHKGCPAEFTPKQKTQVFCCPMCRHRENAHRARLRDPEKNRRELHEYHLRRYWKNPEKFRQKAREYKQQKLLQDAEKFRKEECKRANYRYWQNPEKFRQQRREAARRARLRNPEKIRQKKREGDRRYRAQREMAALFKLFQTLARQTQETTP